MPERDRRLDVIRKTSDTLTELARRYDRLRWMAEQDASDAFMALAEAAGMGAACRLDGVREWNGSRAFVACSTMRLSCLLSRQQSGR